MAIDFQENSNQITLNFLPISGRLMPVSGFTKVAHPDEERPNETTYRFYDEIEKQLLWVRFDSDEDYVKKEFYLACHKNLALHYIDECIRASCLKAELPFYEGRKSQVMMNGTELVIESYSEGARIISLKSAFLEATQQFGICLREDFRRKPDQPFNRAVLIRSGALDRGGRPNSQYHVEAWQRLTKFLSVAKPGGALNVLRHLNGNPDIGLAGNLVTVSSPVLPKRVYEFCDNNTGSSQYLGVRRHGPFAQPKDGDTLLTYVGLERDRPLGRLLFSMLHRGCTQPDFEGINQLFRTSFDLHPQAKFVPLKSFQIDDIDTVVSELEKLPGIKNTIVIVILPRSEEEEGYSRLKARLLSAGIISQFCTRELISANTSLKWAVANIALGIFAKAGGTPWRVKTGTAKAVIIGIAQSVEGKWDATGKWHPTRHMAYSVLTDSSGEFRRMDQLADVSGGEESVEGYAEQLADVLGDVLRQQAGLTRLVVLHCPFTLKKSVMAKIQTVVENVSHEFQGECSFCVVKLNEADEHVWFGFTESTNSLVPLESSLVRLGPKEFLVWFEGVDQERRLAKKRYSAPSHIRFLGAEPPLSVVQKVLEDLVDLAGANWRGFNARSEPVSIYYCKLVAKLLRNFHVNGVPIPPVENLNPWFL